MDNDTYKITVVFIRSLSEDLEIVRDKWPDAPAADSLIAQLCEELQLGYDNGDLSGSFDAVSIDLPQSFFDRAYAERVAQAAQEAFWKVVSERFPSVRSGDLSPEASAQYSRACSDAVFQWLRTNLPKGT